MYFLKYRISHIFIFEKTRSRLFDFNSHLKYTYLITYNLFIIIYQYLQNILYTFHK